MHENQFRLTSELSEVLPKAKFGWSERSERNRLMPVMSPDRAKSEGIWVLPPSF